MNETHRYVISIDGRQHDVCVRWTTRRSRKCTAVTPIANLCVGGKVVLTKKLFVSDIDRAAAILLAEWLGEELQPHLSRIKAGTEVRIVRYRSGHVRAKHVPCPGGLRGLVEVVDGVNRRFGLSEGLSLDDLCKLTEVLGGEIQRAA